MLSSGRKWLQNETKMSTLRASSLSLQPAAVQCSYSPHVTPSALKLLHYTHHQWSRFKPAASGQNPACGPAVADCCTAVNQMLPACLSGTGSTPELLLRCWETPWCPSPLQSVGTDRARSRFSCCSGSRKTSHQQLRWSDTFPNTQKIKIRNKYINKNAWKGLQLQTGKTNKILFATLKQRRSRVAGTEKKNSTDLHEYNRSHVRPLKFSHTSVNSSMQYLTTR